VVDVEGFSNHSKISYLALLRFNFWYYYCLFHIYTCHFLFITCCTSCITLPILLQFILHATKADWHPVRAVNCISNSKIGH